MTDWLPTPENINALPKDIRSYIHLLEARCDPSGDVRELVIAKETTRALELQREEAEADCNHCWHRADYVLTVNPPLFFDYCCYCGDKRTVPSRRTGMGITPHGPHFKGTNHG